jgi:hypothetical protein
LLQKTQSSRESNLKQSFVQIFAIQNAKILIFLKKLAWGQVLDHPKKSIKSIKIL